MKILFLADLHIHYPKKVPKEWQYNRFMLLVKEINNTECDMVLLGGDTLDSAKPTTSELELFFDFLAQIRHRTIIFSGNHEMQTKTHSILTDLKGEIARCNPNIEVITTSTYISPTSGESLFDIIDYCDINKAIEAKSSIAFTHVRGAIAPHVVPEVDLAKFNVYSRVFAGDLHSYQNSQLNIIYPGSPLTTSMHRNRQTDSNGMLLINIDPPNVTYDSEWINLSHLPQLLKKTVTSKDEIISTEYDFTMYELEGNIAELAAVSNSELLDKKVNNVVTKESKLDLKDKSVSEQMQSYLQEVQHLPEDTITRLLGRFNKYAIKKTTI